MNNKDAALHLSNVTKKFDGKTVIRPTNLNLPPGKIYTLIGPNGSGKTTLIKMIVGLLGPTTGRITIYGRDIQKDPREAKKMFGYIPDDPKVYEYLSGYEFLALTGNLRGMTGREIKERVAQLETIFPIKDILPQPMAYYSRGNQQKTALLAALIARPRLLLIDEPIVGLDPSSIDIFGKTLRSFKEEGGTVLFTTHTLPFADTYAEKVLMIRKGTIVKETEISQKLPLIKIYSDIESA